jgi:hypothetical protein
MQQRSGLKSVGPFGYALAQPLKHDMLQLPLEQQSRMHCPNGGQSGLASHAAFSTAHSCVPTQLPHALHVGAAAQSRGAPPAPDDSALLAVTEALPPAPDAVAVVAATEVEAPLPPALAVLEAPPSIPLLAAPVASAPPAAPAPDPVVELVTPSEPSVHAALITSDPARSETRRIVEWSLVARHDATCG